ncbi:hypothetical protein MU582_07820 [Nocardioidaceae bacterium SCSIO 66511]|nr:hypothetical protein MU582_07820 [Nocardioidaceae bacterium SCSIO 66511]
MPRSDHPSPKRRLARGRRLIFLMTFIAAGGTVGAFFGMRTMLPDWGALLFAAFAGGASTVLMGWVLIEEFRRLPAIDPVARTARVTGIRRAGSDDDEPDSVRVRVSVPDGDFDTALADRIHPDDEGRFAVGSYWQVYAFERSRACVLLTEAHDDVLRDGWNLSGLRAGTEVGGSTGYGSELLAWGFRPSAGNPAPGTAR